jgi:hypothetical protein
MYNLYSIYYVYLILFAICILLNDFGTDMVVVSGSPELGGRPLGVIMEGMESRLQVLEKWMKDSIGEQAYHERAIAMSAGVARAGGVTTSTSTSFAGGQGEAGGKTVEPKKLSLLVQLRLKKEEEDRKRPAAAKKSKSKRKRTTKKGDESDDESE